jgi:hypothetical protein
MNKCYVCKTNEKLKGRSYCADCKKEKARKYYLENKEYFRAYYSNNKYEKLAYGREYYLNNKYELKAKRIGAYLARGIG